jgi:hypothetical protein
VAYIQSHFDSFHEAIKLKRFVENQTLREKRDIIRNKLIERLPIVFKLHDEECPEFYFRDQGSYEIGTGTKPLDGDYDIDQGLYFRVSTTAYPDPVVLKQRVYEALYGHTKSVDIRRSCVTVFYQRDGEAIFHVDVAVYSDGSQNDDGKSRLAKGKTNSGAEFRLWEVSNPQLLTDTIFDRFSSHARAQFRRIVRYLKRWKSVKFSSVGNAAPLGIGLTIAVYDHLQPQILDEFSGAVDDLKAFNLLASTLLTQFVNEWDVDEQIWVKRLKVELPVEPYNDLFERMSPKQMNNFEAELRTLSDALKAATDAVDPVEACEALQKVFGDDFPVPERKSTARIHAPAIVSSSNSA